MSCNGCFSGCSEITPDKCVRYTGANIASLEISTGDNLYSVIDKITQYLLTSLDGSGIDISIDGGYLCDLVTGYLGASTRLDDIIVAIVRSLCDVQDQITDVVTDVASIEANYTVDCLAGVTASSGTHDIVQAIITKLCALSSSFTNLVNNLPSTYVAISDLNDLIQDYLDSISAGSLVKEKMIPYVAYPFFDAGSGNFSVDGSGLGNWIDVYLCNGLNGTPDLRGRVIVATTTGMGGRAFDSAVDPNIAGNPSYVLNATGGQNNVTLSTDQLPSHSHNTSISITDNGHSHFEFVNQTKNTQENDTLTNSNYSYRKLRDSSNSDNYDIQGSISAPTVGKTSLETTGISATLTNPTVGNSESHTNIQPVIAANYIMFIP